MATAWALFSNKGSHPKGKSTPVRSDSVRGNQAVETLRPEVGIKHLALSLEKALIEASCDNFNPPTCTF